MARNKVITKEMAMELAADTPLLRRASEGQPKRGEGKIVQVFTNVNMGKGHDGLNALCTAHDIDVSDLDPGHYVVFTNRAMDKVKIFGSNNVIAYLKLPVGTHVSLASLALIPIAFQGSPNIEYDQSLGEFFGAHETVRRAQRREGHAADVDVD